ncbi:hypothetical protein A4X09_0g5394 [Tilletia walkeri]|uniref:Pleckstrin homology domain-containing protein n=1 Tax=Tilletia walkeri TaxID=117179 RepID=A0A8X7N7H3_9BASI|nr:hypothetical protein A4X09_0g5394 [Tilletia walkeri]
MSGPPPLTPGSGGGTGGLGSNLNFRMPARPGSSLRKTRQSTSETANGQSTPSTPGPSTFALPALPHPSPLPAGGIPMAAPSSSGSSLPANPFEDASSPHDHVPITPIGHRRGNSRSSDILLAAAAGSAGGHYQQYPSRPHSPSSSSVGHDNVFDTTVTLSTAVAHALAASTQRRQRLQDLREGLEGQTRAAGELGKTLVDQLADIDELMDSLNKAMQDLQSRQTSNPSLDKDGTGENGEINADDTLAADPDSEQEKEAQDQARRKIASLQSKIDEKVAEMETRRLNYVKALIDAGPQQSPTSGIPASASILDMLAGLTPGSGTGSTSRGAGFPQESPSKNAAAAAAAAYDFLNSDPHSLPASRSTGANSSLAALLAGGAISNGAANLAGGPTARQSDRRARNAVARSSITDQSLVNQLQEGLVSEIRRLQALLSDRDGEIIIVRTQKEEAEKEAALWKPKALQLIENEDALKQENWDLSVAKQTLAEQLTDAQASLRKAEAEKTRLNRDVTKARETLDSQRVEIEAQMAELERIKNLRETEAALARKERAGLQRDYSNLQTEIQHLRADGKRAGVSMSGLGASLGAGGARSASSSMTAGDETSRAGDVSMPIAEEDERAGGRNLLEPGSQGGSGTMSPSSSMFSEMPADRTGAAEASTSALMPAGPSAEGKRVVSGASSHTAMPDETTSNDLRIRLARAHQKSIRDSAERRKQKELISQLTRELQAAGVKLSAGLEGAVATESAEPSDDEGGESGIWLEDGEQTDASRSVANRSRRMPRSSTRPSMASRLGLGFPSKKSVGAVEDGEDEELSDVEDDEAELAPAEEGEEDMAADSKADPAGETSIAGASSTSNTMEADQSSKRTRATRSRARPVSVASTTAGSVAGAETLGAALAAVPADSIEEAGEVSADANQPSTSQEASAQTDELEEEDVWAPAEEEPKTMTESQSMTDPIDTEAPLRAALAERDAAHAAVLSKLALEHRSKMEELVRTHDGVLGDRDANHARALDGRNAEHAQAVEALKAEHESALADAKAAHEKALAEAKAAHEKALAETKSAHEQALVDVQAAHEQTLATETKAAQDKALEQARAHQESALAEARSRHSKALAEQVAVGSASLAAAEALHLKALSDRDAAHKAEVDNVREDLLKKQQREAEVKAATSAALLKQRDEEHAGAIVELKVTHSALIRQKDSAQLAALAERDEALKKARAEIDVLQRKMKDLGAEVERLRKEVEEARTAHDEAVANAAAAATAAAQAAAASGSSPSSVSVSAEELRQKLRPLSGVSDDSTHHASTSTTDVDSSDAFTDAEDHITPARTPTPAQAATMSGLGFGGRMAAGLAAAVGLGAVAQQGRDSSSSEETDGAGAEVRRAKAREEPGVRRVVLAELQDESCQTDDLLWEAFKSELRAEGAAQAQSQMNTSATITGLTAAGLENAGSIVLVGSHGGHSKSARSRDSISTFGGGNHDDVDTVAPNATPTMYSVGAVLGSNTGASSANRLSMESSMTGVESNAGTVATTSASRLDKTKPPHMQVPPPPAMPPPPGLSTRRSQPSPVLAGVPPRPTSPPPPELVSRVREQQQRSTLQVPGSSGRPSLAGVVASNSGGSVPNGNSSNMPHESSLSSLRTRKYSHDNALSAGLPPHEDHLSAHSRRSRRGKVPRKSSQTSFASDVTSELSRRMSFGSSEAPVERRESHAQLGSGAHSRAATGSGGPAPDGTDPDIIQAITQTMIGEYLFKYTRKTMRAGYSDKRHKRFFWVHPYTRMLYWTLTDPGGARVSDGSSKGACIEDIRVVEDTNPNPPGLFHMSIIVKTAAREMKLTAPNKDRHDVWLAALGYLVNRGMPTGDAMSMGDGGGLTDQENRMLNAPSNAPSPRKPRDRSATTGTGTGRSRFLSPARSLRSRKSNDAFLYAGNQSGSEANDATPRPRNGSVGATGALSLSSTKRAGLPARDYLEQVESDQAQRRAVAAQRALLPARSHLRPRQTGASEHGQQANPSTPGKMSIGSAFGIPGSAGVVAAQNVSPKMPADDSWDRLADLSSHSFNDPRLKTAEEMLEEDNEGFDGLDNVRACCDGKHDVGSLAHKHHHHHHHQQRNNRSSFERRSSIGSQTRSFLQVGAQGRPSDVGSARSTSPAPQIGHLNLATNSEQAATWSAGSSAQPVRTGNFATMFNDSPIVDAGQGDGTQVNEFGRTTSSAGPASNDTKYTAKSVASSTGSGRGTATEAFINQVQRIKAARQSSSAR